MTEVPKPVNVFPSTRPTGFTLWLTAMFVIFVVLPVTCIQKAVHTTRNTVASFQFEESDIAFIALEEGNWAGIDATGCRGHLSAQPVATMDRGRRALYAVESGHQLPAPWVTPKYVWVREYDDGDTSYNAVYEVFRTPTQVKQWAEQHGYKGEFQFSLLRVAEKKPDSESGKPYAAAHVPHYVKGNSMIQTTIFTHGAGYAVYNGKVFESDADDETYQIYERVAL